MVRHVIQKEKQEERISRKVLEEPLGEEADDRYVQLWIEQ